MGAGKGDVSVPVTVLYKKSLFKKDGSMPLLLEGYGSYGISEVPLCTLVSTPQLVKILLSDPNFDLILHAFDLQMNNLDLIRTLSSNSLVNIFNFYQFNDPDL